MFDRPGNSNGTPGASSGLTFKIATEDREFLQINRLNHRTFADEIQQHPKGRDGLLIDRFDDENTYFICLSGKTLLGMVCARSNRPFSLDEKLGDLDRYLPAQVSVCEIRLLAIEKERRKGRIIQGLMIRLAHYCLSEGYGAVIISGNVSQAKLYRRLGFRPFGPEVGTAEATFQPMILDLSEVEIQWSDYLSPGHPHRPARPLINLLPGPVAVSPEVQRALARPPISHRLPEFVADVQRVKERLCWMVGAQNVELMMGSGTLANDAIAGQLSLNGENGLVLSNGEFGNRLRDHARGAGLRFDFLGTGWGQPFERRDVEEALDRDAAWLWAVHCETSTGVLNDLPMLKNVCAERGVRLAMDCVSSVGTSPVDLSGVALASCASGKGLGAYPGLSMVFYDDGGISAPGKLPRYLDLGQYAVKDGVPYTLSTNLVYALDAAVRDLHPSAVFDCISEAAGHLRVELREMGFRIVAADECSTPAVTTIALPAGESSLDVGQRLESRGFLLSYNSEYLFTRNWIQVCLMVPLAAQGVTPLLAALRGVLSRSPRRSVSEKIAM